MGNSAEEKQFSTVVGNHEIRSNWNEIGNCRGKADAGKIVQNASTFYCLASLFDVLSSKTLLLVTEYITNCYFHCRLFLQSPGFTTEQTVKFIKLNCILAAH